MQGEENQPLSECLVVAEQVLQFPPRDPSQKSLEVDVGYNESGMVNMLVRDLVSKQEHDITIDFYTKST